MSHPTLHQEVAVRSSLVHTWSAALTAGENALMA